MEVIAWTMFAPTANEQNTAWNPARNGLSLTRSALNAEINSSTGAAVWSASRATGRSADDMKVYMKPVEMIALFTKEGIPHPLKYKIQEGDEGEIVVRVDQVITRTEEKLAGNRMIIFSCQSEVDGVLKPFELKFEIQGCKWFLWKM